MKKFAVILLAAFMVMGFSTTASAVALDYAVWVDASSAPHEGDGVPDTTITLAPSEVVWLDVYIDNIPEPGLLSGGLYVDFDPAQLELTAGTVANSMWYINYLVYDNDVGYLDWAGGRLDSGGTGTLPLITIELHCTAPGVSFLDFGVRPGGDVAVDGFVLADGTVIDLSVLFPSIEVINTPIPGALWLLGSGLVGLVGLRRKRS